MSSPLSGYDWGRPALTSGKLSCQKCVRGRTMNVSSLLLRRARLPRGGRARRADELRDVVLERLVRGRADVNHVSRLVVAERDTICKGRVVAEVPEVVLGSAHRRRHVIVA